jgi:LPS export ABC transporter protein LptC
MMFRPTIVCYLLGCIGCTILLAACENNPQEVNALTRKVIEVEEGKNIKALFTQSGNRKAYLTAPFMSRVKADTVYVEFPRSIHIDFYDDQSQLQNVVTAKYARYFELMGKVFLRDSVVVTSVAGDTLHCKSLWWIQNEEAFYTEDSVVINTKTQQLNGSGLRAKSDFSKYTILNSKGMVDLTDMNTDSSRPATADTAALKQ